MSFIIASTAECELGLSSVRKVGPGPAPGLNRLFFKSHKHASLSKFFSLQGYVTAGMFVGMMIGGWLWGALADRFGRKPPLMVALAMNSIFGLLSSMTQSYAGFLVCRILSGVGYVGQLTLQEFLSAQVALRILPHRHHPASTIACADRVGGSIPIVFTYVCEFLPVKARGPFLNLVATFWMVGTIIAATLAWIIIGLSVGAQVYMSSWQGFVNAARQRTSSPPSPPSETSIAMQSRRSIKPLDGRAVPAI